MEDKNYLSRFISIIGMLLVIHYFISYRILSVLLSQCNLQCLSILSVEDVLFSFAGPNITILFLFGICLFASVFILHFIKNEKTMIKNNIVYFKILTTSVLIILFILIWYFYGFDLLGILLYLFVPLYVLIFCKWSNWADLFLLAYIGVWATFLYQIALKESSNIYPNEIVIHLKDKPAVSSDASNKLLFFGTKYIVLKKGTSKSAKLYPVSEIDSIEWLDTKTQTSSENY